MRSTTGRYIAHKFVVEGFGIFPLAMLAIDTCQPSTYDEYVIAFVRHDGYRQVEMLAFRQEAETLALTIGKWQDFGWTIKTGGVMKYGATGTTR